VLGQVVVSVLLVIFAIAALVNGNAAVSAVFAGLGAVGLLLAWSIRRDGNVR
jgi:hypothetical protein